MRTQEEIKERIRMALVEGLNNIVAASREPENLFPQLLENLTNSVHEIVLDEINVRRLR